MARTIETKYLGATNHRGSRVMASTASGKRLVDSWDHASDQGDNHKRVAQLLAVRMGWDAQRWIGGETRRGYVWVQP